MSKAIGGYVRRCERCYVPPAPDDGIPRCGHCRARLDLGMFPHLCKELTFGTPQMGGNLIGPAFPPERAPDFSVPAGEIMASIFGAPERPGPPYVHTFVPPRPCPTECDEDCELNAGGCHERHAPARKRDHDPDECEALQQSGPAYTLTEGP